MSLIQGVRIFNIEGKKKLFDSNKEKRHMTYNEEVRLSYLNQMRDKRHLNMKIMRERKIRVRVTQKKKKIVVGILFFR